MTTKTRQPRALKSFIYRVLLRRLVLATLVISVAVAIESYYTQRNALEKEVANYARLAVRDEELMSEEIMQAGDPDPYDAFRRALAEAQSHRAGSGSGIFVYARFYNRQGGQVAELERSDHQSYKGAKALTLQHAQEHPAAEEIDSEMAHIGGQPVVLLTVPILNRAGEVVGFGQGVYAPSDQELAAFRANLLWRVALAVGIVIATALLLYPIILHLTKKLAVYSSALLDANMEVVALLGAAIAKRDSDTDAHNYRVTFYAAAIGEAVRFPPPEMQSLLKGAFLHDLGKLGVSDNILLKPGKLSDEEFVVMKTHVRHGLDIIEGSNWLADTATIVGYHHEKFDGSGYPKGAKADSIPAAARVFAIADVFDALTSKRPYHEAKSCDATLEILELGRGTHFDPVFLDAFRPLAPTLYEQYGGRTSDELRPLLTELTAHYFAAGLDSLSY
jgi:HD-GYP domain-containing protein (c-di-GMP phosphodiesterase class II)